MRRPAKKPVPRAAMTAMAMKRPSEWVTERTVSLKKAFLIVCGRRARTGLSPAQVALCNVFNVLSLSLFRPI